MTTTPSGERDPFADAWTADKLMAADFPDPKWAVPGVLCEGVTLLAGPPKVGKSWMSLGLGLSIASGKPAFGTVDTGPAAPVLYLALEDTARRLKTRMGKMLGDQPAPHLLTLVTECPPLPQGGDTAIAGWLRGNPAARLVVIDVFAKVRGSAPAGVQQYDADYLAVGRAKRIADHFGVAVVLVHHVRKATHEDFLATVSGTNGIAGAADAVLVLERGRNNADGVLHITGRDVEEADHALSFNPDNGAWTMLEGPAVDHTASDTRRTILFYLRENSGSTPAQIATGTGLDAGNTRKTCQRMHEAGQLTRDGTGRYFAPLL
ncbi:DNA repair protein RadA [Saccharothrix sp. NRRL B-16348]|uniref:AAA family ATPase n=1 Tax=Saccharothrix sp. NRRL B-16348 TaxID=1415542 RepID=UPI0006AFBFC7|nr:AAA family ATPase [Saccharothrix sp. NRRL B-16348]KOX33792.1 DNA repair protein RadA [Saccharothrix sp. NRRL B-16348]